MTPEDVTRIRESFGFSKEAFARILGMGIQNFKRYESGHTISSSTIRLLRVLEAHPEVIEYFVDIALEDGS